MTPKQIIDGSPEHWMVDASSAFSGIVFATMITGGPRYTIVSGTLDLFEIVNGVALPLTNRGRQLSCSCWRAPPLGVTRDVHAAVADVGRISELVRRPVN